jgi:undecaprenyl-diphosphatase
MMTAFLTRLDARDRALFLRWALGEESARASRRLWTGLTTGGGATATIGGSLGPLLLADGAWRAGAGRALLLLVLSHLLVQLVKRTVGRPRPSMGTSCAALVAEPDRFSFPSGHAAAAMSLALGYGAVLPAVAPLLISLAAVVGFSRVALGVHYPGDVVVGQALALLTGALVAY